MWATWQVLVFREEQDPGPSLTSYAGPALHMCLCVCFPWDTGHVFFKGEARFTPLHLSTHDRCWFSIDRYCIKEDRNETCGFRFLQNMQRGSKENMDLWFILSLQSDAAWGNIWITCYHVDKNNKITGPVVLRTDDVIVKEDREKAELLGCHSSFIAN